MPTSLILTASKLCSIFEQPQTVNSSVHVISLIKYTQYEALVPAVLQVLCLDFYLHLCLEASNLSLSLEITSFNVLFSVQIISS